MSQLAVVFVILLGTILITPVADRLKLPYPVLITVFGLVLAVIPNAVVPALRLPPELILPLVLPPLLYAATQRSSWRSFVTNARPILLLAVALVFVSTAAVAAVAGALLPGLPVAATVALGAIVAAPDAAAATSVANRLRLPRRLVSLIEGEGLFNDVTALTLYQVAVAGVVTGSFSAVAVAGRFVYSAVAATAIGLLVGVVTRYLLRWLPTATLQSGLSLLVPFVSYVAADRLEASGVLAVLATGFYLGHYGADPDDAEGRLQSRSFWEVVELLVTGFAFGLIGLELTVVLNGLRGDITGPLIQAGIVCAVVIAVRIAWMLPAGWLSRARSRRKAGPGEAAPTTVGSWRESVVLSWSGMRGVVTVATALALPLDFPERSRILLISFAVILATLVLQGLTLPWLVRVLGVTASSDRQRKAERAIAGRAFEAALRRLNELVDSGEVPTEVSDRLRAWFTVVLGRMRRVEDGEDDPEMARRMALRHELVGLEAELLSVARREVLEERQRGADPAAADRVLRRLDLRSVQRT
ncbi:cation:proton antiporter [Actinocatenispora rupis]|uniref:Na+/H+ antiporter n=1 Tax=Actinocatenispora rupis TaxID=519421 RepID=A0A8J3JEB8_9ACTN|nr:sodium:proton antiporter [Actinocatenispora rupis]GID15144.1 Na+/H+ antiporter [Actinocatenispora rupis]